MKKFSVSICCACKMQCKDLIVDSSPFSGDCGRVCNKEVMMHVQCSEAAWY